MDQLDKPVVLALLAKSAALPEVQHNTKAMRLVRKMKGEKRCYASAWSCKVSGQEKKPRVRYSVLSTAKKGFLAASFADPDLHN